jgi:hypothetical protein
MSDTNVTVATIGPKLSDGVRDLAAIAPEMQPGCRVFLHYNGPTDQLRGVCAGMAVLEPGASPHPPHRHPEEEFLIIADGPAKSNATARLRTSSPVRSCIAQRTHCTASSTPAPCR